MISVAICGEAVRGAWYCDSVKTVEIDGAPVTFGRVETTDLRFDPAAPENRHAALVKVRAFSCNYRDKAVIVYLSGQCGKDEHICVGSEFAGEVVATGHGVTGVRPGDRVIGNNEYPVTRPGGAAPGIPTNHSSQNHLVLHEAKLMKIPAEMSYEAGAAFSVGAQTAYSMIRKLEPREGANVLVTSAKSNTSLFVINALKKHRVKVYATSTSTRFEKELKAMGVEELIQVDPALENFYGHERIKELVDGGGGFDYVIDPFFDLHVGKLSDVMAVCGKYITCGLYEQYSVIASEKFSYVGDGLKRILTTAVVKNNAIIGSCLGQTEDLRDAIEDYRAGLMDVIIDSTFGGYQVGAFIDRTYNDTGRFGKVVFRYDD